MPPKSKCTSCRFANNSTNNNSSCIENNVFIPNNKTASNHLCCANKNMSKLSIIVFTVKNFGYSCCLEYILCKPRSCIKHPTTTTNLYIFKWAVSLRPSKISVSYSLSKLKFKATQKDLFYEIVVRI